MTLALSHYASTMNAPIINYLPIKGHSYVLGLKAYYKWFHCKGALSHGSCRNAITTSIPR